MDFDHTPRVRALQEQLTAFMRRHVLPADPEFRRIADSGEYPLALVDALKASSPAAPPRAMVLVDSKSPVTPHVFKRGNPNNLGDEVPRQFPAVLAGPDRKPFKKGSGRLEMADAIASRDNPLTGRVIVNRTWLWHFGSALVRTPSDFGMRSDPPTNPELLDYLASVFVARNPGEGAKAGSAAPPGWAAAGSGRTRPATPWRRSGTPGWPAPPSCRPGWQGWRWRRS